MTETLRFTDGDRRVVRHVGRLANDRHGTEVDYAIVEMPSGEMGACRIVGMDEWRVAPVEYVTGVIEPLVERAETSEGHPLVGCDVTRRQVQSSSCQRGRETTPETDGQEAEMMEVTTTYGDFGATEVAAAEAEAYVIEAGRLAMTKAAADAERLSEAAAEVAMTEAMTHRAEVYRAGAEAAREAADLIVSLTTS